MLKNEDRNSNFWYLDIGCSNHMSGNKRWFLKLYDSVKRRIKFADNSEIVSQGIGKVLVQRKVKCSIALRNLKLLLKNKVTAALRC
jgi:hypothetical protein